MLGFKNLNIKSILFLFLLFFFTLNFKVYSETDKKIEEIKTNIESHNNKIKELEQEIKAYEREVSIIDQEAKSLQNTVKTLDINQKKIGAEIKKTETSIEKTNLSIEKLDQEIEEIQKKIGFNTEVIAKTIKNINQLDENSLFEIVLSSKSLADFFDNYESKRQFQQKVREQLKELEIYKSDLNDKKITKEKERVNLVSFKLDLIDQNKILTINKQEKDKLLTQTKNKEAEYRKMLAERQAEKEKFERELFQFESQLKIAIDPNSFPSGKKGILSYPLDNIFITQYFGKTVEARKLYVSGTHNGVDFRASRGTPVKSVLTGVVQGTGDTDIQKGCYSYGKWILIKHPNGLSSLYAHLDLIRVTEGQSVNTGDIIGYSGQTGYATGPHLHLTLYATQGVEIQKYSSSRNCKNVSIPLADSKAYLDPMLYF